MTSQGEAIAALIINLVIPGVGTIIWGERKTGIWQLVLAIIGYVTMIVLVGFAVYAAAWIWALVSSINIVQNAE